MDPEDDYYDYGLAVDTDGDRVVANTPLTVVVPGTTTPTPITDMVGVPIVSLASSPKGTIPQFRSVDGLKAVDILSGALRTRVTSVIGRQGPKGDPGMGADPSGSTAGQVLVSTGPSSPPEFSDGGFAPLTSPALTGAPTAPTPPTVDTSDRVATTSFVKAVVATLPTGGGGGGLTEDPANPGLYVLTGGGLTEDPANPGLYLIGA